MFADPSRGFAPAPPVGSHGTVFANSNSEGLPLNPPSAVDKSSEVDKNAGIDRNSVKLVYESSVVVETTGLMLEGLDEKAVVYQKCFLFSIDPILDVGSTLMDQPTLCRLMDHLT